MNSVFLGGFTLIWQTIKRSRSVNFLSTHINVTSFKFLYWRPVWELQGDAQEEEVQRGVGGQQPTCREALTFSAIFPFALLESFTVPKFKLK